MSLQLTHDENQFEERQFPIVLIAQDVKSPANLGSLFRLADAFQIEKLIATGVPIDLKSNRLRKTARATTAVVNFEWVDDVYSCIQTYQQQGYDIFCLEITSNSVPIETFTPAKNQKAVLIVGEENTGVSEALLQLAKNTFHIRMFGKNSSMNLAQATGIALYEFTKKWP